jgi:methionine biosynthesis protein MetW
MSDLYDKKHTIYREFYNPYLLKLVPAGSKVLDIGCNGGQFGKLLISEKGCTVYGVDISLAAVNEAQDNLTSAIVMDIENDPMPFKDQKFDIVVFGDVLEHLANPAGALAKVRECLQPDGRILVSLPNVANISIRLKLLIGCWDYRPSGILDETHLRFFTRRTMQKLFAESGYAIEKMDSTPGFDFFIANRIKIVRPLINRICKLFPKLFANQFVFRLKSIAG